MRLGKFGSERRGQTLFIVALMLIPLLGFTGLVSDVAWYEVNLMRIQRAADAAALAGVVYLPGNVAGAQTAAEQEAAKNGYTNGDGGVTVTATPEALNNRILGVTVSSPIRSWFARLLGITQFSGRRNARAEFVLPVPMGSPEDYYGINVVCRNTDTSPNCPQVPSAAGASNLAPLGFFGGVEARGTERQNGDAYSTYYNNRPTLNTGFDANGYQYIVEFGPGTVGGSVWLYDPMFCATGAGTTGGRRLGAGDNWFTNGSTGITTVYNLLDMRGTPYTLSDDTLLATSGALFANSDAVDKGPLFRGNQNYGGGANGSGSAGCPSKIGRGACGGRGENSGGGGSFKKKKRREGRAADRRGERQEARKARAQTLPPPTGRRHAGLECLAVRHRAAGLAGRRTHTHHTDSHVKEQRTPATHLYVTL